jgi:hypothetical protein
MFDLDHAISEWRRQLAGGGIDSPEVLDELESHLRDDIEEQARSGISEGQAFQNAVHDVGQPSLLKTEFVKASLWQELSTRLHHAILTLAGIPTLATHMNTPNTNIEPRWATYLKASAFLLPALSLWAMSVVFIAPKLKQICLHAGGVPLPSLVNGMLALTEHATLIVLGAVLVLAGLEWRFTAWPRYRRATVGIGTFLLNAVVLIAIFLMVVSALLAAPALIKGAR